MGKSIYSPKGAAAEYGKYAAGFYVNCSNSCSYCFLKKYPFKHAMGGDKPTLKKCFRDEAHALEVFKKELQANLPELQKHGLFFTFTSDPMLPETATLTTWAIVEAAWQRVKCTILTKMARPFIVGDFIGLFWAYKRDLAIGFTLTGHDYLEPNASPNAERIEAMRKLHEAGFKTFVSAEPIIDFENSKEMILKTAGYCDLYKIGLESGKKYDKKQLQNFIKWVIGEFIGSDPATPYLLRIYFKDSLLRQAGIQREDLPANCVTRDYDIFKNVEK